MSSQIYLALGSNLGDRAANLQAAIHRMPPGASLLRASPVYETPPWGYLEQPAFLNQVLLAETGLEPVELLRYLKNLEIQLGRQPAIRYGPRLIDLDILLYGDLVLESPGLVIPHPRLAERPFVLVPLADLAPDLRHPVSGKTVRQLLGALDARSVRVYPSN